MIRDFSFQYTHELLPPAAYSFSLYPCNVPIRPIPVDGSTKLLYSIAIPWPPPPRSHASPHSFTCMARFPPPQDRVGWANKGQQRSKFWSKQPDFCCLHAGKSAGYSRYPTVYTRISNIVDLLAHPMRGSDGPTTQPRRPPKCSQSSVMGSEHLGTWGHLGSTAAYMDAVPSNQKPAAPVSAPAGPLTLDT